MNPDTTNEELLWFAMSAPYRRELKAQERLNARGIETFVPMTVTTEERGKTKKRKTTPAIHNLIFVHTTKEAIKQAKQDLGYLQYRTIREEGKNKPVIVPPKAMEQFISITQKRIEELTYLKPEEINIEKGTKVRIHGGTFDGTEGVFVKIKGKRNRRVVVLIEGIAAVAINAEISHDFIEII